MLDVEREVELEEIEVPLPSAALEEELNPRSVRALATVTIVVVLGLSTWFSAGAVLPQLLKLWNTDETLGPLLTAAVNVMPQPSTPIDGWTCMCTQTSTMRVNQLPPKKICRR